MKRILFAMTLLALAVIFSAPAPAQTQPVFDHFLCYYVPNQPVLPIPLKLQDQFDAPAGTFESPTQLQIMRFCNPVTKVVGSTTYPIGNINHHLTLYQLNPQPIIPRKISFTNQFANNLVLYTSDPRVLAVPTGKGLPPDDPPSPSPDLDHYKCYVASGPNANAVAILTDQFISNQRFLVVQPVLFCNPVMKINGSVTTPIQFPANHLTCYALTPLSVPATTINIANQFIANTHGLNITVNNPDMLCAPTTKNAWSVVTVPPATASAAPARNSTSSTKRR